jgi:hypothetical protein
MAPPTTAQPSNTRDLLQFSGYIISNAGIARWGSRLTNPPHTFPPDAAIVASEPITQKLKAINLAGLLNVGTPQNPRFVIFTKNQVVPYRETVHENDLASMTADKWDKWTLRMLIQEQRTFLIVCYLSIFWFSSLCRCRSQRNYGFQVGSF